MDMQAKKDLQKFAVSIRKETMRAIGTLGVGHVGGALSICDVLAVLYGGEMNIDPADPHKEDRDWLVCSKGHAGPAVYATLALKGFFPKEELLTLNKPGTNLPSHCDMNRTPGIDMTTGSLGQGTSSAVGIACGNRKKGLDNYTYLIIGDGESQEGQIWEAYMAAAHYKLDNLTVIIDNNGLQIDGSNDQVMSLGDLGTKLHAFGFDLVELPDGNDLDAVEAALSKPTMPGKPKAILAHTVKGKGVSFMENQVGWHGKAPNAEQRDQALKELEG